MIKCDKGEIHINGWGSEVAPEVGCIMNYFFEHATEKETIVALETFKEELSDKARLNFIAALTMVMK